MTTIAKVKIIEIKNGPFLTDDAMCEYFFGKDSLDVDGKVDRKSNFYRRSQSHLREFEKEAPDCFVMDLDGRMTHLVAFIAWRNWTKKYRGMERRPKFLDYYEENKNAVLKIL